MCFNNDKGFKMNLKLAKTSLSAKPAVISLEEIEEAVLGEGQKFFYFDQDNADKDILKLVKHFEKKGVSIYHRQVKYGLDELDFIIEVHIL